MNLCEYFPCAKRPSGKRKSPCKAAVAHGWEGGMGARARRLRPSESILDDLSLECPAIFDAGVTFPGECVLDLGPGFQGLNRYTGPCVLSKAMQMIPCPKQRFMGEVRISSNFSYRGPCRYVEGRGVVPARVH